MELMMQTPSDKREPAEWTAEEIEDLLTDAIGDSFDMDWVARDGAKAIMRELAECGLHITYTDARRNLIANPPITRTPLAAPDDGCWYPIEQCTLPHCDCNARTAALEAGKD
jgi:hypothetical protein